MLDLIKSLYRDRKGGTAIEYGLIAALVVITMIAGFTEVANTTTSMWRNVNSKVDRAAAGQ